MNKYKDKKDKFAFVRIIIYIISVILVILVRIGILKTSCYWYDNYGITCPSCGLTRATNNILNLKFKEAFGYNAIYTCSLFPLLIILIINDLYILTKRYILKKADISYIEIILGYKVDEYDKND